MEPNYSTEIETSIRSRRINLLPSMRYDQCTLVRPSVQKSVNTHDRGAIHSGASLHDEGERLRRVSSGSGAFTNDVRGSDGIDRDAFSESAFDPYHTPIRPMTLSRVVSAAFLNFIWWKHIADYATEQTKHYDKVLRGLEDYEKAVKQNAEPKLLGGQVSP